MTRTETVGIEENLKPGGRVEEGGLGKCLEPSVPRSVGKVENREIGKSENAGNGISGKAGNAGKEEEILKVGQVCDLP